MRRAAGTVAATAVALVLTGCSGVHAPPIVAGHSRVVVDSPSLVRLKRSTQVPDCPKTSGKAVADGMPAMTVPCLGGGRKVDLAGLRGPMIVNFWQSYCSPCRTEMPALAAYAKSHPAVKIVGIDILDTMPGAALQLARDSKVAYPLVADPAGNLDGAKPLPRIPGLPFTVFLDPSGKISHVEAGAMSSEADVAAAARKYLGVGG
jgi:thiol-disulfide isomerase/thioredoxin